MLAGGLVEGAVAKQVTFVGSHRAAISGGLLGGREPPPSAELVHISPADVATTTAPNAAEGATRLSG
jgi:hypothetical protein